VTPSTGRPQDASSNRILESQHLGTGPRRFGTGGTALRDRGIRPSVDSQESELPKKSLKNAHQSIANFTSEAKGLLTMQGGGLRTLRCSVDPTMTHNQCKNASLDWCPLSGTRLESRFTVLPVYRIPCRNRLRRRSLLVFLRLSQNAEREICRQFSLPTCQSSRPG
jgi:hypothetical protein